MRGTIKSRTPGSYTIIASYKDADGKRKQVWRTFQCNKKEAEQKLRELLTELDKGTFISSKKNTLRDYLRSWLEVNIKPNLSAQTYRMYAGLFKNHISTSFIADYPLKALTPTHLENLYAQKRKDGTGQRTVQLIHILIHKALRKAVRSGLVYRNVADLVDKPEGPKSKQKIMTENQIIYFLTKMAKIEYDFFVMFLFYLHTGCRRKELLKLHWRDADFEHSQLYVKGTKTNSSRRSIALSKSALTVLTDWRTEQNRRRSELRLPLLTDDDLIFCHFDGTPWHPDTITHRWFDLTRQCGIEGVKLHGARHTMATLMLKMGVHPKVVQERLGHASISTTLDIYSETVPGLQEAAAEKLDSIFSVSKMLAKPNLPIGI